MNSTSLNIYISLRYKTHPFMHHRKVRIRRAYKVFTKRILTQIHYNAKYKGVIMLFLYLKSIRTCKTIIKRVLMPLYFTLSRLLKWCDLKHFCRKGITAHFHFALFCLFLHYYALKKGVITLLNFSLAF